MPRGAARADEVGGHHRLAVAGRERVHRAPAERGEQQQEQHALAGGGVGEHAGEAVARRGLAPSRGRVAPRRRARPTRAVAGRDREARARRSARARQQVLRVAAQAAGRVVGGHARAHGGPAARARDDRPPADAAGEGPVAHLDARARRDRGAVSAQLEARRRQPARAGREGERRGAGGAARAAGRRRSRAAAAAPRRACARHLGPRDARAPGTSGSRPGRARSGRRRGRRRPTPP